MLERGASDANDPPSGEASRSVRLDGVRCRDARQRLGFSRQRLAELARGDEPLSEATIKRAEAGQAVYLDKARRLAEVLRVPLQALLISPVSSSGRSLPAEGPAVAVLPFRTELEDEGHFTDGLAEDLTIRLGHSFFPVIARGSSFRFREPNPDRHLLREQLAARYVVEGGVRRDGGRVRVTATLTDTETETQLWADIFEANGAGLFEMQDRLSSSIARAVGQAVFSRESARVLRQDPADLAAWELSLRGAWHFYAGTKETNLTARDLFQRALEQDSFLPLAWYWLGLTYQKELIYQWGADPRVALEHLTASTIEFERRFPNDPWAHVLAAYGYVYRGDRKTALIRLEEAIELDPNSVAGRSLYGQTLAMAREPDLGIAQLKVAIRLSPKDPELPSFHLALALCHFAAARYTEAIQWAERSLQARPEAAFCHGTIGAAYAHLGDLSAARQAIANMTRLGPGMSMRGYAISIASTHPEIAERYLSGLKMAGFSSV